MSGVCDHGSFRPISPRRKWFAWHPVLTPTGRKWLRPVVRQRWERPTGRTDGDGQTWWRMEQFWRYADPAIRMMRPQPNRQGAPMPARAMTNDGSVIISDGKSQIRLSPDEALSLSAGIRAAADSLIASEADRHDVNILPNADEHRRSLGFTLADVAEAVYDPIRWMPDESSPSRLRCVGERGLEVVAAFTDETPMVLVVRPARSFDADSASWRRGGGGGSTKRTPKSLTPAQLAGRLADMGVDVDLSAGHYIVGRGKNQVTFASTPSDHRWLANTLARLRLLLDIDLREE